MSGMADRYVCSVCGFPDLDEPPWTDGSGSNEICPSCGIHFGYDDAAGGDAARREAVYREWRRRWIDDGMKWWSPSEQPSDWDPQVQVRAVGG